jgi:Ca2+/Na+ antiporter
LPWFGIFFAAVILMIPASISLGSISVWLSPMMLYLFFILVNLALIGRARRRAREAFAQWANSAVV